MMTATRLFAIISLIALPTVMYGGYSLRRLMERREGLTEFQRTYFRAGHAHAGVLVVGILAQSGGFFVHMAVGRPDAPSSGTLLSTVGAVLLAAALLFLAYALVGAYSD